MRKLKELTKEQELEILSKRQNGIKRKDIISEYGISDRHYQKVIIENGGELNQRTIKFNFNEDYFEKLNPEKFREIIRKLKDGVQVQPGRQT